MSNENLLINAEKWEKVKLGDMLDYQIKSKFKAGEGLPNGNYKFFTSSNIQNRFLNEYTYDRPSLVFGTGGSASIHFCQEKFSTSTDCLVASCESSINLKYIYLYLKGNMHILEDGFKGAGLKHISKDFINNIQMLFPPIEVQKKIAVILDKVSELIEKRKMQIAKLDELTRSIFVDMFGDPVTNPKGWQVKKLLEFYINSKNAIKCGPFGSALKKSEYVDFGIPVWTMDNISKAGQFTTNGCLWILEEKFNDLQSYNVINGDIIISRAGTVGKMCVVNSNYQKSIISTNLIRLRLNDDLMPLYFVMLINIFGNRVVRLKTGKDDSFTYMNTGVLNSISFPYPPKELQNEFADIVEKIEQQKTLFKQGLEKLELNYKSLMQKLFN